MKNRQLIYGFRLNKNQIDKAEFKKFYQTELQDIDNNLAFSEKLSKSIHALEPEYQRISAIVGRELQTQAKSSIELRQEIERDSLAELR